ncbi:MAG TPA: hypothetical protein VIU37_12005, partial [Candidatus Limnocylindrales bacterium]
WQAGGDILSPDKKSVVIDTDQAAAGIQFLHPAVERQELVERALGRPGFVTQALEDVLKAGGVDAVYAVGPVPMMRAVSELTRPFGVPTLVSLNAIMVDGTGMCGGCRVSIDGKTRYACVDGPEFDGHQVDFRQLSDRLTTYRTFEQGALERREACRVPAMAAALIHAEEAATEGAPR